MYRSMPSAFNAAVDRIKISTIRYTTKTSIKQRTALQQTTSEAQKSQEKK